VEILVRLGVALAGAVRIGLGEKGDDVFGDGVQPVRGDDVAGERLPGPRAVDIPAGRGVIDNDRLADAVDQLAEIATGKLRRRNRKREGPRRVFAIPFIVEHEEALVAAVVDLRNEYGAADLASVLIQIVLPF